MLLNCFRMGVIFCVGAVVGVKGHGNTEALGTTSCKLTKMKMVVVTTASYQCDTPLPAHVTLKLSHQVWKNVYICNFTVFVRELNDCYLHRYQNAGYQYDTKFVMNIFLSLQLPGSRVCIDI